MMLHGAADNWVPAAPCREYAARLKNAGREVRWVEYADAHHIFDAPVLAKITQFPNVMTPAGCRLEESDSGVLVNAETKQPLTPSDSCWVKGASAGYSEAAAKKAHEDVKAFLVEIFQSSDASPDWLWLRPCGIRVFSF
jgi:dienelactone hydrolase